MIGQVIEVGHNAAKNMGFDYCEFEKARVEAIGFDWVVLRSVDYDAKVGLVETCGRAIHQQDVEM